MTEIMMQALVAIVAAWPTVLSLTTNVMWDTEETDPTLPAVTMRTLATTIPARDLNGRGGVRRVMVELSASAVTLAGSVQLLEAALAALQPYEAGYAEVVVASGTARIGAIHLDDVTQSPPVRERSYRQTATLIVAFYE